MFRSIQLTKSRIFVIIVLIWLAFLVRGIFYATVLPMWEGFDEYAHVAFIQHLSAYGSLPSPDERVSGEINQSLRLAPLPWPLKDLPAPAMTHDDYWNLPDSDRVQRQEALNQLPAGSQETNDRQYLYEGKQPPLYYLLGTWVLRAVLPATLATRVFALRLFSILIASLIVPLTFVVSRRLFDAPGPAVLAAALVTSMPGLFINVARVSNDCLAMVLFGILAYALLRPEPWDLPGTLLIGTTMGAGLLAKAYFVAAIPAVALSGITRLFKLSSDKRMSHVAKVSAAAVVALALSAWWYLRTLGAEGPVWADVAPKANSGNTLYSFFAGMHWWEGVKVAFNGHFWIGGWSFLGVRSWIYTVLRGIFFLSFLGSLLWMVRSKSRLWVIWCLYAAFWVALFFHAFVNYANSGIPASMGWYLNAVVACEAAIVVSAMQWLPARWQGLPVVSLTGLFLLLEAYATHFVLIPYYIGLIHHRPDGTITSFHVTQALDLGRHNILSRLLVNKASFMGPWTLVFLWVAFALVNIGLFVLAWKCMRGRADG